MVDVVDATGAVIWPGDAAATPSGSGTVVAVLESGDDMSGVDQVVVTVGASQAVLVPAADTVTSRASEAGAADQVVPGEVA